MPTVPDIHRRGTRAAQASVAAPPLTVGTLYFVTDEGITERWTGTAWESYSGPSAGGPPAAHHLTHAAAGSDPVTVTALAGFPGGTTSFLRADGTFAAVGAGALAAHHASHETGGADAIVALAAGVITTGTIAAARLPARVGAVGLVIDGGGAVLTTGVKGDVYLPFACTLTASTLIADVAGSVVLDLKLSASYATVPTVSIVAGAPPTLATAASAQDTSLTGWTVSVAAGSRLRYSVTSAATLTRLTHTLTVSVP